MFIPLPGILVEGVINFETHADVLSSGSLPTLVTMDQTSAVLYTSTIGTMYRSHVSPGAQGHICSSFAIETFPVSFVGIFHFCVFVLLVIIRHPLCWQNQPTDRKPRFFTIKYCNLRPALTRLAARYSNYPFDSPIFSSLSVAVFTQKSVPLAPKEMKRRSWHRGQYVNLSFDPSTRSSSQSPSPFFFALALTCRAGIMLFKGQLSLRKFIVGSRCVIF